MPQGEVVEEKQRSSLSLCLLSICIPPFLQAVQGRRYGSLPPCYSNDHPSQQENDRPRLPSKFQDKWEVEPGSPCEKL